MCTSNGKTTNATLSEENMGDVVAFNGITTADEPPESVLEKAKDWDMGHCLVIGCLPDGELIWGGSTSDMQLALTLLERARFRLLSELDSKYG